MQILYHHEGKCLQAKNNEDLMKGDEGVNNKYKKLEILKCKIFADNNADDRNNSKTMKTSGDLITNSPNFWPIK